MTKSKTINGNIEAVAETQCEEKNTNPSIEITRKFVKSLLLERAEDAHKGTYGHALLVCGSYAMPGAALLATAAALRSGCGLVTAHVCDGVRIPLIANYPSAMLSLDESERCFSSLPQDLSRYNVVGIGCGLGRAECTTVAVDKLLKTCKDVEIPMVIDADAINIIAMNKHLMDYVPQDSILTPHLGELKRLVGEWQSAEEMLGKARALAQQLNAVVIVKGPSSSVLAPDGSRFVNTTGNAGMAKGGSGDVLTGFITGLRARGYSALHAAILGVWIHGLAGDKASVCYGQEAMNSADIIDFLSEGFIELE